MKKILILSFVLISGIFFFIGYNLVNDKSYKENISSESTGIGTGPKPSSGDNSTQKVIPIPTPSDPIKDRIEGMTLNEKIGQMVIVGMDGYENNVNTKNMINNYKVGGFVFFSSNIESPTQLLNLVNSLKTENVINKTPLFFSVDEEGGRVTRLPKEIINLPSSKSMGKKNNADYSFKIGELLGDKLNLFGLNMDFAPVLDINSNPKNPVIGDRAFGSKADIVIKLGVPTMKGIQSKNIISVVKHFPGHGDTSVDSHIGLPMVQNDLERLQSFELLPFEAAINEGADAVMVAHILLPKIDSKNPASFSKVIITDILRSSLKFKGVVITDDMTMGAISKNYDMGEAAVKSILAGTDIVLVCHYFDKEVAVIDAIKKAVTEGVITEKRIDQSVYRVLTLKSKYSLNDEIVKTIDINSLNDKIGEAMNLFSEK